MPPARERTPEDALAYAKERALRLLTVRPRSRAELLDRLSRIGVDEGAVGAALEDLERVGLVDDAAFARQVVEWRAGGRLEGDRAVRAALRAKGVDPAVGEAALHDVAPTDEEARALELAERRARRLSGLPPERAYARLLSFLQRRGYAYGRASAAARRALAIEADAE